MYIGLHVKYRLFLSEFYETSFLDTFSKNDQISNTYQESPSNGAELFHEDKRTDGQMDIQTWLFTILRMRLKRKKKRGHRCTYASLILSLSKCYFNLVNNLWRCVNACLRSPCKLPRLLFSSVSFRDTWSLWTSHPRTGYSRCSWVLQHGLKGNMLENLYGRTLEILINSAERSCSWMISSTNLVSIRISWNRCTLSRLKLNYISHWSDCPSERRCAAVLLWGEQTCLSQVCDTRRIQLYTRVGKQAAKSVSPPLLRWTWYNACKMHFSFWRETPLRIPGWSQTSLRSNVSVI
jgi:hypothetical protein